MCTYNGVRHLDRQLATIADQTVAPTELVVCDDRSSDDTISRLTSFARRVSFPVRVHINDRQLGAAQNFSGCLARCTGDVIVLTDQDDLWAADRLARTQAAFAADAGLSFTYSDAPLIDEADRLIGRTIFDSVPILKSDRTRLAGGRDLLPVILRYGVLYGATMAIRRRDATLVLPVPPLWSHDEWLSLALSAIGQSARLAEVTSYRQHAAQVVGAGDSALATTFVSARNRTAGHYDAEAERQRNGLAAAAANPVLAPVLAPLLEAKLGFIEHRRCLHRAGMAGVHRLIGQIWHGNYARFAGGTRSMLKDMAMMAAIGGRHD